MRNQRFSASFHHAVETVVNMLMPHITQKYRDNPEASKNANHSLATFIKVGTQRDLDSEVILSIILLLYGCYEILKPTHIKLNMHKAF